MGSAHKWDKNYQHPKLQQIFVAIAQNGKKII
jgi:hypothetical protein